MVRMISQGFWSQKWTNHVDLKDWWICCQTSRLFVCDTRTCSIYKYLQFNQTRNLSSLIGVKLVGDCNKLLHCCELCFTTKMISEQRRFQIKSGFQGVTNKNLSEEHFCQISIQSALTDNRFNLIIYLAPHGTFNWYLIGMGFTSYS